MNCISPQNQNEIFVLILLVATATFFFVYFVKLIHMWVPFQFMTLSVNSYSLDEREKKLKLNITKLWYQQRHRKCDSEFIDTAIHLAMFLTLLCQWLWCVKHLHKLKSSIIHFDRIFCTFIRFQFPFVWTDSEKKNRNEKTFSIQIWSWTNVIILFLILLLRPTKINDKRVPQNANDRTFKSSKKNCTIENEVMLSSFHFYTFSFDMNRIHRIWEKKRIGTESTTEEVTLQQFLYA